MSHEPRELTEVLSEIREAADRRTAFIEAAAHATPEQREAYLRVALKHSRSQRETIELAAVAGVFADGIDEKIHVLEISHEVQPDDVNEEMKKFGVTFNTKNPVVRFRVYEGLKANYPEVRHQAKAAIGELSA